LLKRFPDLVIAIMNHTNPAYAEKARPKNFPESSASSMFVYALLKGMRLGYLPTTFAEPARRAWTGMQKQLLKPERIT
jgi:rhamnogalacturonyl hydrolase YesR